MSLSCNIYYFFPDCCQLIFFAQSETSVANFCVTAPLLYDYVRSIVGRLYFKDLLTCAIYLHWSNPLRSVHTGRQVAATCRGDTLQRQIAWCVLDDFCENLCRCNKSHNFSLTWFFATCCSDKMLLRRQRFSQKIIQYTRSDLLLRRVASPCCCNYSPDLYTWSDLSPRRVATTSATCRLVSTDL